MKFFLIDFNKNIFVEDVKKLDNIYFSFPNYKNHNFYSKKNAKY